MPPPPERSQQQQQQPPPLNVIALVSGGKDSFFALLHCLAQGHRVVALANLFPAETTQDGIHDGDLHGGDLAADLDSYMYQTAGHALIPRYAQALPQYPLYRQPIRGRAADAGREYGGCEDDETESLLPLLRRVRADHPAADALATGAILSTYQRTRVESVCARLGLVSLAYLWQYPVLPRPDSGQDASLAPDALLEDIAAAGLDARIVKVASAGLDASFLWQSLADPAVRRRVRRAIGKFGGSALGEGGEFETLVVAGPPAVWRGRLHVGEDERVVVDGGGGAASLAFTGGTVLPSDAEHATPDVRSLVRIPGLWDPPFDAIVRELESFVPAVDDQESAPATTGSHGWHFHAHVTRTKRSLRINNLTGTSGTAVADQMDAIGAALRVILAEHGLRPSDVVGTTILLRSIHDFARINRRYSQLFTEPIPPARVTVAVGEAMPDGADVALSATASFVPRTEQPRRGLHVQSRSYWAPANIGPYAQAVAVDAVDGGGRHQNAWVYVAGQIPLVPAAMDVLQPTGASAWRTFGQQAVLAAQHLWRIGAAMRVRWWTGAVVFLQHAAEEEGARRARLAGHIWRRLHRRVTEDPDAESELTGPDIWDQQYGGMGSYVRDDESERRPIPDVEALKDAPHADAIPGFVAVEIHDTPRQCAIEWQSLGLTGGGLELNGDDHSATVSTDRTQASAAEVCFHLIDAGAVATELELCLRKYGLWDTAEATEASDGKPAVREAPHATLYTSQPEQHHRPALVQCVPCRRLWASDGRALQAAVVVVIER